MSNALLRSRILAAAAACALGLALASAPTTSGAAVGEGASPVKAGADGPVIVVDDQAQLSGFDLATDPSNGVAYLAWISSTASSTTRAVHLCVLPPGTLICSGGVLTTGAVDGSSAAGIQVEIMTPGYASLYWFHNVGLATGALSTATYTAGALSPPTTYLGAAPVNGVLFDVVRGPDGRPWTVTRDGGAGQNLNVSAGITNVPANVAVIPAPWLVGNASLAFQGSQPVLLVAKYGSISDPLYSTSGSSWPPLKPVAKTWTTGVSNDLVGTSHGVRAIVSEPNAGYRPAVGKWTGSDFKKPELIGEDDSCPGLSHDLVSDDSGRLADVVERCGKLIIYNLPDTKTTAEASFATGGTNAGSPQITTTARGYGWVAWSILSPTQVGNRLQVRSVRLPALMVDKTKKANPGKVTVKGPATCLPVVSVKAKVSAKPNRGWSVADKSLSLDGDGEGNTVKIDGEKLDPGSKHVLLGKVVFRKGGQSVTVDQKLKFKVC